jgi:hypothetical protein
MLPGALVGLAVGWMTAAYMNEEVIQLILGITAVVFVGRMIYQRFSVSKDRRNEPRPQQPVRGSFWGVISGFTSFVSHAGGPPFQIYTVPLRLDPKLFAGTSTRFFAVMNFLKLWPYFELGQFDTANLMASAVLLPLAPLATLTGAYIVKRMRPETFYPLMYALIALTGLKLVGDGIHALMQ